MKYNITPQGPTSLSCPKCNSLCNFEAAQKVILCKKCGSKLKANKASEKIAPSLFMLLISVSSLRFFIEIDKVLHTVLYVISLVLFLVVPYFVYKNAYLCEIENDDT